MEEKIMNKLAEIFRVVFNNDNLDITIDMVIADIENWDSLRNFVMITEVERAFDIKFSLRDLNSLKTVRAIVEKVTEKLS